MKLNSRLTFILTCLGMAAMPLLLPSFNNGPSGPGKGSPGSMANPSAPAAPASLKRTLQVDVVFRQAANDNGNGLGTVKFSYRLLNYLQDSIRSVFRSRTSVR